MKRKNEKDHHKRKSQGSAEFFRKQRKARNAARPKQSVTCAGCGKPYPCPSDCPAGVIRERL